MDYSTFFFTLLDFHAFRYDRQGKLQVVLIISSTRTECRIGYANSNPFLLLNSAVALAVTQPHNNLNTKRFLSAPPCLSAMYMLLTGYLDPYHEDHVQPACSATCTIETQILSVRYMHVQPDRIAFGMSPIESFN